MAKKDKAARGIAQRKADKTYADAQGVAASGIATTATYATWAALQTAFPVGNANTYLVAADGKWYYWSSFKTAWVSGGTYQKPNLLDPSKLTFGSYIQYTNGIPLANPNYCYSDYIPVVAGDTIASSNSSNRAAYNASKVFISGVNATSMLMPAGAAFYRQTILNTDLPTCMVVSGASVPAYTPYGAYNVLSTLAALKLAQPNRRWEGEEAVAIGDSITEWMYPDELGTNYNYRSIVANQLGLASYKSCAENGKRMKDYAAIMTYSSTTEADLIAADLITVFLGQNDKGTTLGTIADPPSTDGSSFYGSCKSLINYLLGLNPTCTLAFVTPTPSAGQEAALKIIADAIMQVCELYSVPVLDLYRCSNFNSYNYANLYTDASVHPNGVGMKRIGRIVASFLESL